jgi:hypothetical protein
MRSIHLQAPAGRPRAQRLWIVETLVVLGVLAFGYFAVTLDAASWGVPQVPAETSIDPLLELTR